MDASVPYKTDMPNNTEELRRLVVLLTPEQLDFVSSKVDRVTSRSSYVRDLIVREMEGKK